MVERRVIIAILLMLAVAILPSLLFPPKKADKRTVGQADSGPAARPRLGQPATGTTEPSARPPVRPSDTIWVTSPLYRLGFSTLGGEVVWAELLKYQSFAPGDSSRRVQLVPAGGGLLAHRLAVGADTVSLADWSFVPSARTVRVEGDRARLTLTAEKAGARVVLDYEFVPGDYRFRVSGRVTGLGPSGAVLMVGMGEGFRSVEADSGLDFRNFKVVTKAARTESKAFASLDSGEVAILEGPFEWVGVKSKYFFAAALAIEENQPQFAGAIAVASDRQGRAAPRTAVWLTLPVPPSGEFRYQLYVGPLEYRQLAPIGHELDDANPYGWIFRPIVKPVANFVVTILLWMHERLSLAYGWVLVFFGVLVRILLWPLNQKAMQSQLRMQAVAPLLKETQERYKDEPERLQREMTKLYKEHKVNPFGGCFPMLLPMPVLFALFFVFDSTIEFRGVPFLWLPDLSRADPSYIIPLLMGLSMFAVSKVGMIGMPPNPQSKMFLYFMPIMMVVFLYRFASGLNLYYTVSNVCSIPQQYLIARRRLRELGGGGGGGGPAKRQDKT